MSKRICLLIPDGVGIRNYLYSDVIKHISAAGHAVVVWHSLPDEVIEIAEKLHGISIEDHTFEAYPDTFFIRLYREASAFARLRLNSNAKQNETILCNWNMERNTLGKKVLYLMAETLGKSLKSYDAVENLERKIVRLQQKSKAFARHQEQLKAMHLDVLFCTHQRAPHVVSAMLAAQNLGIHTATAIFSWDNLPKARLPFRADQYMVWSDYMRAEMLAYYPDIPDANISVSGTPQFDFYRDESIVLSREAFAEKYELDTHKKWVLFSGDDRSTSPYDVDYLKDVAKALEEEDDIQIVFRQVPVETVDRYAWVLEAYKAIRHLNPEWQQGLKWEVFYPKFSDISLLVNLAKHCAAVINVGSTMSLDFANFNTPCLFINYNQPHGLHWSVEVIYRFQHFRSMDGLNPVGWINSIAEIAEKVKMALEQPDKIGPDRKEWLERIIQPNQQKSASERIVKALLV